MDEERPEEPSWPCDWCGKADATREGIAVKAFDANGEEMPLHFCSEECADQWFAEATWASPNGWL